jgi:hypothetical protein
MEEAMKKILALSCAMFVLILASFAQGQSLKTVKGNYCGKMSGNRAGMFGFRVGAKVMTFDMNFGQKGGNARMIRFNINKLKVGDEFIVKYNSYNFITVITGTGKRKKIEPCTLE